MDKERKAFEKWAQENMYKSGRGIYYTEDPFTVWQARAALDMSEELEMTDKTQALIKAADMAREKLMFCYQGEYVGIEEQVEAERIYKALDEALSALEQPVAQEKGDWADLRNETQAVLTWAHNVSMNCQDLPDNDKAMHPIEVFYLRILCESVKALETAQGDRVLNFLSREKEVLEQPRLETCPKCGGVADNGHDRELPPNPYLCSKCEQPAISQEDRK